MRRVAPGRVEKGRTDCRNLGGVGLAAAVLFGAAVSIVGLGQLGFQALATAISELAPWVAIGSSVVTLFLGMSYLLYRSHASHCSGSPAVLAAATKVMVLLLALLLAYVIATVGSDRRLTFRRRMRASAMAGERLRLLARAMAALVGKPQRCAAEARPSLRSA